MTRPLLAILNINAPINKVPVLVMSLDKDTLNDLPPLEDMKKDDIDNKKEERPATTSKSSPLFRKSVSTMSDNELKSEQERDSSIRPYLQAIRNEKIQAKKAVKRRILATIDQFAMIRGVLHCIKKPGGTNRRHEAISRLVVPQMLRHTIMQEFHDSLIGGHQGVERTFRKIADRFWWPQCYNDVYHWVKSCEKCAKVTRPPRQSLHSRFQQYLWAKPCQAINVDSIGPLPESNGGNKFIIVGIDCFSRYIELRPTPSAESIEWARFYAHQIFPRHGAYEYILTDRVDQFNSDVAKDIVNIFQSELLTSASGHPQCGAIVERSNKVTVDILRKLPTKHKKNWK